MKALRVPRAAQRLGHFPHDVARYGAIQRGCQELPLLSHRCQALPRLMDLRRWGQLRNPPKAWKAFPERTGMLQNHYEHPKMST